MSNIRIKDLTTTAATTASDDFVAVDGTTNGTRKLNAYSPTFGGNLTASGGSITVSGGAYPNFYANGTTGGVFTIQKSGVSYGTFYGNDSNTVLDSAGSANLILQTGGATRATLTSTATTLTGNLTVSGTGTSSFAGRLFGINTTSPDDFGAAYSTLQINAVSAGGGAYSVYKNVADSINFRVGADGQGVINVVSNHPLLLNTNNTERLRVTASGNVLVGTTTDSANGKIQLATHTTSAGGIGFGTDWGIYRKSQYTLGINVASGAKPLFVYTDVTNVGFFDQADVNTTTGWSGYYITPGDKALKLATNNTTALTLDSSQNATFAKTVNVGNGTSNSSYQNIYTNKSENTAGPVSITLPADCAGTVRVSSYQSGVGRSFRTIPFINFGGTVTLGTSDTTVLTADPITSIAAGTGAITLNLYAGNTNVYWGIDVVKA